MHWDDLWDNIWIRKSLKKIFSECFKGWKVYGQQISLTKLHVTANFGTSLQFLKPCFDFVVHLIGIRIGYIYIFFFRCVCRRRWSKIYVLNTLSRDVPTMKICQHQRLIPRSVQARYNNKQCIRSKNTVSIEQKQGHDLTHLMASELATNRYSV